MSISTKTELKTAFDNWSNYASDTTVTNRYDDFITLSEAFMQRDLKLVEFEGTGTVAVSSGSGSRPADYVGMRSVYWDGDTKRPLEYITPAKFDGLRNNTGQQPSFYTISGTTLRVDGGATGNAIMTYYAKFTALGTTNTLLTSHPDVYLYAGLRQISIFVKDDVEAAKYTTLLTEVVNSILKNNADRKHAGPLRVVPR